MNIAVHAFDVIHRFAVFLHLRQAEDNLKMIHKIVALASQRRVQIFELPVGFFEHPRLIGDAAGDQRVANVHRCAPDHDQQAEPEQRQLRAARKKGHFFEQHVQKHADHGENLEYVDGDGKADHLFNAQDSAGLFHIG